MRGDRSNATRTPPHNADSAMPAPITGQHAGSAGSAGRRTRDDGANMPNGCHLDDRSAVADAVQAARHCARSAIAATTNITGMRRARCSRAPPRISACRTISRRGRAASSEVAAASAGAHVATAAASAGRSTRARVRSRAHEPEPADATGASPVLAARRASGPHDGRDDAAREHCRDRAAFARVRPCVGGGQPVVLRRTPETTPTVAVRRAERPEVVGMEDRPASDTAPPSAPTPAPRERSPRDGRCAPSGTRRRRSSARPRPRDQRERQCGERLVVGERVADEPGQRQIDRYRRCVQRLGKRPAARAARRPWGSGPAQIGGVVGEGRSGAGGGGAKQKRLAA